MARQRQKLDKSAQQDNSQSNLFGILFGAGMVVVIGLAVYFFVIDNPQPLPELDPDIDVESVEDNSISYDFMGNDHIADNEPREYNSNPPTSGNHNSRWVTPIGTFTRQLSDTRLIHNLEHGHVWLSYRDEGDDEAIEALRAIQEKYSDRVVVTYRPDNDTRIAAAAWTQLLPLDTPDSEQLEAFIVRYSDNAPESLMEG